MANSLVLNQPAGSAALAAILLVDEAVPATVPVTIRRVGVSYVNGPERQSVYWEVYGSEAKAQGIINSGVVELLRLRRP